MKRGLRWITVSLFGFGCLALCAQEATTSQGETTSPGMAATRTGPLRISSPVMAKMLQKKVQPVFSGDAEDASGTVVVTIVIGEDGAVKSAVPLSGPEILQAPVLDAVKQWIYTPSLLDGKAVEVQTTVTIRYGVEETVAAAQPAVATPTRPDMVRVPGGVAERRSLKKVPPVYPPVAKQMHVTGSVIMRAVIGKDGKVEELAVISGPEMLRKSALTAVGQWTYSPYVLNGVVMKMETVVVMKYDVAN